MSRTKRGQCHVLGRRRSHRACVRTASYRKLSCGSARVGAAAGCRAPEAGLAQVAELIKHGRQSERVHEPAVAIVRVPMHDNLAVLVVVSTAYPCQIAARHAGDGNG